MDKKIIKNLQFKITRVVLAKILKNLLTFYNVTP